MVHPIAFVHIPKTAGNALDHFLFQEVSPGRLLQRAEDRSVTAADFRDSDIIAGHLPFLSFKKMLGNREGQIDFLSCVRDPVSRLKSNLYYQLTLDNLDSDIGPLSTKSIREKGFEWTLKSVLEFDDFRLDWCRNIQWTLLTTDLQFFRRATSGIDRGKQENIAEKFLESYAAIIVQEQLEDGILLLGYTTRRLIPRAMGKQNTNATKPSGALYDLNDEKLIEEVCGLDQVLYDAVKRKFDAQYERMVDDVLGSAGYSEKTFRAADQDERYAVLRTLINEQILAERESERRSGPDAPAPGYLGRAGVYPGAATRGLGCRLVTGPQRRALAQDGRPATDVLWIGPETPVEIWFSVAATDRASYVGLKVGACLHYQSLSKLAITCNGRPVDYTISEKIGDWFIIIPLECGLTKQLVTITAADVPHIHEVDAQAGPISQYTVPKVSIGIDEKIGIIAADEIGSFKTVDMERFLQRPGGYTDPGPITLINPARISEPRTSDVFQVHGIITSGENISTVTLKADKADLERLGGFGPFSFTFFLSSGQSFDARCFFEAIPNTMYAWVQINVPLGPAVSRLVGFTVDDPELNRLGFQRFDNVEPVAAVP